MTQTSVTIMLKLTSPAIVRLAARAGVDPRTVRRLLAGRPIRPSTAERISEAMAAMGLGADGARTSETLSGELEGVLSGVKP